MLILQILLVCAVLLLVSFTAAVIVGMCIPRSNPVSRNLRNSLHAGSDTVA